MMECPTINVLQLISSLQVGGSEKLLLELLKASKHDKRIHYTVVVMNREVDRGMRENLDRLPYRVYYLNRMEGERSLHYLFDLLKIIQTHQIEILHAHNQGSKWWGALCKLFNPRLKLVVTIHDTTTIPRMNLVHKWIQANWIDFNIAISKTVLDLCKNKSINKTAMVYNGIPVQAFSNDNRRPLQERLEEFPLNQDHPLRILHIGRMDVETKGQDILIDAIRRCREAGLSVCCFLIGGVYDYNRSAYERIQKQVQDDGLSHVITFRTELHNQEQVIQALKESELFILPSRHEGLGLVLLEAMAAGIPIIASNIEGPRELIEERINGFLFESMDSEDLYQKIRMIYENPSIADSVSAKALEFIQRFDIQTMQQQYAIIYSSLVDSDYLKVTRLPAVTGGTRSETPV